MSRYAIAEFMIIVFLVFSKEISKIFLEWLYHFTFLLAMDIDPVFQHHHQYLVFGRACVCVCVYTFDP